MNRDPILNKAALLAKKHDYEGAIRILDAEENRYSGSCKYYYLYGLICLYSDDFGGALSYFKKAKEIKIKDPQTMLALAALYLRRINTNQAVDYYLDVKDNDPSNKIVKKALAIIRKYSNPDDLSEYLTPKRMKKLYPPIPGTFFTKRNISLSILIIAVLLLLFFGILAKKGVLKNITSGKTTRPAAEFMLSSQDKREPLETGGIYRYILTRDQAISAYERSLSMFTSYRDEAAKINLNRILESNASQNLKAKAKILMNYMEVPGFDNFHKNDNPLYADVKNDSILYRDVYVIWKGMATNVEILDEYTRFDFLVGYDTRKNLEGIVQVNFNYPVTVNPERPLEVLGKIVITDSSGFYLLGEAIHQSGKLD
jgi:tetratricopeptide (TPR) repeat protein